MLTTSTKLWTYQTNAALNTQILRALLTAELYDRMSGKLYFRPLWLQHVFPGRKIYNFHQNPFKAFLWNFIKSLTKKQFGFSTKMKPYQWANQSCCSMKFFSKRVSRRLIDIFHYGTEQHFYYDFLSHDCGTRAYVVPTRWIASMKVWRSVLLPFCNTASI